ncbi:DUF6701 domain-containing protein [Agaribacterium sp. ZY112]|uniref:DUF6701 domain-containing protein n=1 Tax=Agaribacterium sp. ZY112 TaxID=3233574 RepID=UPI0035257A85
MNNPASLSAFYYRFALFPILFFLGVLFFSNYSYSAACSATFADGASNSSDPWWDHSGGSITFTDTARIVNSPDGLLATDSLNNNGSLVSCDTQACARYPSWWDQSVPALDYAFSPGGSDFNLWSGTGSISPGNYRNLQVSNGAALTMEPGDYHFQNFNNYGGSIEINSSAAVGSSVRIFVQGNLSLTDGAGFNTSSSNYAAFVYTNGTIGLFSNTTMRALLYTRGTVTITDGHSFTGAIVGENSSISVYSGATITYDPSMIDQIDFGGECDNNYTPPATPILEWLFDEGSGQQIIDSAGSLNAHLGDTSNPEASDPTWVTGYSGCALEYDHRQRTWAESDSSFDPPEVGTVVFWLKMGDPNNQSRLFGISDSWEIRRWSNQQLYFDLNQSGSSTHNFRTNTTFPNNGSWHHIAAVFNADDDEYEVYVDGNLERSGTITLSPQNANILSLGRRTGRNSQYFSGIIDEYRVYDSELSQTQIQALRDLPPVVGCSINALDNFNVDVGGGSGSVCTPSNVIITARDSSGATLTDYTGTVTITSSTGNGTWSSVSSLGTLTPGAGDSGSATYQFVDADNGQITLALSNEHAETLQVTVSENGGSVSNTSNDLTFSENAFVVSSTDSLLDDLIAGRRHSYQVQMLLRDPDGTECGPAPLYNEPSVKAWIQRSAADPSGTAPTMLNAVADSSVSLLNTEATAQSINLNFSAGVANFSLDTSDVGQYSINFYDDSLNFSDLAIRGSSASYTARPFAFLTTVTGNPEGGSSSAAVFQAAGLDFEATTQALAWSGSDDVNGDGRADVFSDTNRNNNDQLNGAVLPSFGQEGVPETLSLSATLESPVWAGSGGTPELSSSAASGDARVLDSFSGGEATTSEIYFPEVGVITLLTQVTDGQYLGSNTDMTSLSVSPSVYVGRFTPARFEVGASSAITPFCTGFSYLAQPWDADVSLQALNSRGVVTQNYKDGFAKLTTADLSYLAGDAAQSLTMSSRLTSNSTVMSWLNGTATIASSLTVPRLSAPDGPFSQFTVGFDAEDSDSVGINSADYDFDSGFDGSNDSVELGSMQLLYGRLRLDSAFGPETETLPVNYSIEYWNGSYFELHAGDSCTDLAQSAHNYPNGSIDIIANRTVAVGAGTSTGSYTDDAGGNIGFSSGDAGLSFSAPGSGNTGSFLISTDLTVYPWLQFDWNQNGSDDSQTPQAEINFGTYRSHDRIIFWQEVLSN